MQKITAILIMTIRAAMRSRVFAAIALFIIITIISLPFIIKGDGTPESRASIFINYAFTLLMFILSLTATWCGAGAISLEISNRQMQNLVTKPLGSFQILAGKLLGLMTINLLLLALGGTLIWAMIHWTIRPARTGATGQQNLHREIMTVYRTISPVASDRNDQPAIGPGQNYRWPFNLAQTAPGAQFALLKFRLVTSPFYYQSPVTANWRVSTEEKRELFNKTTASSPNMTAYLNIPRPDTSGFIEINYLNLQTNPPVTVFFPSEDGLCLLIPESSFEANLLRGLIMGFARLSFFTSLGIIAGALFTFPVAVFVSMGLLITAFSSGFMRQIAEKGLLPDASCEQLAPLAAILNDLARGSFSLLAAILPPLDRFNPLDFLPDSLFIPWNLAGQSLAVLCVLYPLILMLISAVCLNRREVGLPSQ